MILADVRERHQDRCTVVRQTAHLEHVPGLNGGQALVVADLDLGQINRVRHGAGFVFDVLQRIDPQFTDPIVLVRGHGDGPRLAAFCGCALGHDRGAVIGSGRPGLHDLGRDQIVGALVGIQAIHEALGRHGYALVAHHEALALLDHDGLAGGNQGGRDGQGALHHLDGNRGPAQARRVEALIHPLLGAIAQRGHRDFAAFGGRCSSDGIRLVAFARVDSGLLGNADRRVKLAQIRQQPRHLDGRQIQDRAVVVFGQGEPVVDHRRGAAEHGIEVDLDQRGGFFAHDQMHAASRTHRAQVVQTHHAVSIQTERTLQTLQVETEQCRARQFLRDVEIAEHLDDPKRGQGRQFEQAAGLDRGVQGLVPAVEGRKEQRCRGRHVQQHGLDPRTAVEAGLVAITVATVLPGAGHGQVLVDGHGQCPGVREGRGLCEFERNLSGTHEQTVRDPDRACDRHGCHQIRHHGHVVQDLGDLGHLDVTGHLLGPQRHVEHGHAIRADLDDQVHARVAVCLCGHPHPGDLHQMHDGPGLGQVAELAVLEPAAFLATVAVVVDLIQALGHVRRPGHVAAIGIVGVREVTQDPGALVDLADLQVGPVAQAPRGHVRPLVEQARLVHHVAEQELHSLGEHVRGQGDQPVFVDIDVRAVAGHAILPHGMHALHEVVDVGHEPELLAQMVVVVTHLIEQQKLQGGHALLGHVGHDVRDARGQFAGGELTFGDHDLPLGGGHVAIGVADLAACREVAGIRVLVPGIPARHVVAGPEIDDRGLRVVAQGRRAGEVQQQRSDARAFAIGQALDREDHVGRRIVGHDDRGRVRGSGPVRVRDFHLDRMRAAFERGLHRRCVGTRHRRIIDRPLIGQGGVSAHGRGRKVDGERRDAEVAVGRDFDRGDVVAGHVHDQRIVGRVAIGVGDPYLDRAGTRGGEFVRHLLGVGKAPVAEAPRVVERSVAANHGGRERRVHGRHANRRGRADADPRDAVRRHHDRGLGVDGLTRSIPDRHGDRELPAHRVFVAYHAAAFGVRTITEAPQEHERCLAALDRGRELGQQRRLALGGYG